MTRDNYPLPWCDKLDVPYWSVNLGLISTREGWKEWQTGKPMSEIIPKIDELLA